MNNFHSLEVVDRVSETQLQQDTDLFGRDGHLDKSHAQYRFEINMIRGPSLGTINRNRIMLSCNISYERATVLSILRV